MAELAKSKKFYFINEKSFKGNFDNVHFFVMKNYNYGMHKQSFFEINIITAGSGTHYIGDNQFEANVGDVFIVPPEMEHGYTGGKGFDVHHVTINNRFIQQNLSELQMMNGFSVLFSVEPLMRASVNKPLYLKLSEEQFRDVYNIINTDPIDKYRYFKNYNSAIYATGMLLILISTLCRIYEENMTAANEGTKTDDEAFMRSVAMIHERYSEKLTINMLAKEARLSKSTFMRRFIDVCKMPPNEYIIKKRIEAAEGMLINSSDSLNEIADATGFYDSSHFSRTFKSQKGTSPSEYRRLHLPKKQT